MSKKTIKKSAKNKVSKKKVVKTKSAKPAPKKAKKVAPKKVSAKKAKAKKVAKPVKAIKSAKKVTPKKTATPAKKAVKKAAPKKKIEVKKTPKETKVVAPKALPKAKVVAPVKATPSAPAKAGKPAVKVQSKPSTPFLKKNSADVKLEKVIPDPPGKFELEYIIHTSTPILFEFLTSPSGLTQWFCDDVNIRNGVCAFKWEDNTQDARLVKIVEESVVRYQWLEKTDGSYFEFRIERDDLTNDISLIVVDFAENAEERISSTLLWNSQIDKLLHVLGSY